MLAIEAQVLAEAVFHDGHWTFERKATLEWFAQAEQLRTAGHTDDANEAYIVSGRLQSLDNNDAPAALR